MHSFTCEIIRLSSELCKAKLTVKLNEDGTRTYKRNTAAHTHILDARDKAVKKVVQKAKQKAKDSGKSSRALYAESLGGQADEIVGQMPKVNAFGKTMRNQRKGNHPPAPKTLAELAPLNTFDIRTTTGEPFLLYDSRNDVHQNDTAERIIMFSTKAALDFLAMCDISFMDGTFFSGPALFEQMYTIHGKA